MPTPPKHLGLAVLEGRWRKHSNLSVRPLFDLIAHEHFDTPDAYHYEMFCDDKALRNIVKRVATYPHVRYVYLAAHGSRDGICGSDGDVISTTKLINAFAPHTKHALAGVYFGCCDYLNADSAWRLLQHDGAREGRTNLAWVAGFSNTVDWLRSSAFDLLFFREMLEHADAGTPLQQIAKVAEDLRQRVPDLIAELGFEIYRRKRGGSQEIEGLLGT